MSLQTRPPELRIDCHRGLRGPYTGAGTLLRTLVPSAWEQSPHLVREHADEILSVAPDLAGHIGGTPGTLTSTAQFEEQTRLYPAGRTRRLAHGLVDFVIGCAASGIGPPALRFTRVGQADSTDREFLALLSRRAPGDLLAVTVEERPDPASAPARDHAARQSEEDLVQAYVRADGTSSDPSEVEAYRRADPAVRAALHQARAAELTRDGDWGLRLGAIPYHLEYGADPATAGPLLREAAFHCRRAGFYDALHDLSLRGRSVTDPVDVETAWLFDAMAATGLCALRRIDEAEHAYLDIGSRYVLPKAHIFAAYGLAMVYARYRPPEQQDYPTAKAYINTAITLGSLLPEPETSAFETVFNQNGLAFIEMRHGDLPEALCLVTEGLDRLDRELPADRHRLHRSVLVHNRARVNVSLGRFPEALADFDAVIGLDPNYPDYYVDRGNLRDRLGDATGALADYDTAIGLTPPFWELHHDRAGLRARLGDTDGAVADLCRVLELEPDRADDRATLVGLLLEAGRTAEANRRVDDGLHLNPEEPRLLHLRGSIALEQGDVARARRDFDLALAADPDCVAALSDRAALAFELGDPASAADDLTRALELVPDDPDLRYNRAYVHQAAGRWDAALADYTQALELPGSDTAEVLRQRATCLDAMSRAADAA